jgi:hypothetical protein
MSEESADSAAQAEAGAPSDPAARADKAEPLDEFDPKGWQVPAVCKDCSKDFNLPYPHFRAGVVSHCPHCRGSFVPLLKMDRAVRDAFIAFYSKRRRQRDEFAAAGGDRLAFDRAQMRALEEFRKSLAKLARTMRPAGKMVKPRGLRAMFT